MGSWGTRKGLIVAGLAVATTMTSPLFAQQPVTPAKEKPAPSAANKARAAELFKKGADAYLHGDFAQAITILDEAYGLDPQPVLIYNKARAHEGLGHTDDAIKLYEQYLAEEPSSPDRGAIEQRLATLKKQQEERIAMEKERAAVEKERAARAAEPPPPPPHKRSVLPYVVAGVGVAGLAAGGIFGIMAKGKESDGEAERTQRAAIDARDSGSTLATVANISFIAGGALVVAGAVWWALDGAPKRRAALPPTFGGLRVGVAPTFLTLGGTFQ